MIVLTNANASSADLKRLMILPSPNQLQLADYDPEEAFLRFNHQGLPLMSNCWLKFRGI
jgi:hypothetical protein